MWELVAIAAIVFAAGWAIGAVGVPEVWPWEEL